MSFLVDVCSFHSNSPFSWLNDHSSFCNLVQEKLTKLLGFRNNLLETLPNMSLMRSMRKGSWQSVFLLVEIRHRVSLWVPLRRPWALQSGISGKEWLPGSPSKEGGRQGYNMRWHELTGLILEHPGLPEDTQKYLIALGRGVFYGKRVCTPEKCKLWKWTFLCIVTYNSVNRFVRIHKNEKLWENINSPRKQH